MKWLVWPHRPRCDRRSTGFGRKSRNCFTGKWRWREFPRLRLANRRALRGCLSDFVKSGSMTSGSTT